MFAKYHLKKSKLKIKYYNSSPENLKLMKRFDIILNMEIVEHVEDIDFFIKESSKFLKKIRCDVYSYLKQNT